MSKRRRKQKAIAENLGAGAPGLKAFSIVEGAGIPEDWETQPVVVKASEFYKRMKIQLAPGTRVTGWLATPYRTREGKAKVKLHFIRTAEDLKALRKSDAYQRGKVLECWPGPIVRKVGYKKLREAYTYNGFSVGDYNGTGSGTSPSNEFYPIMGGPFNKQLYLSDYLEMHAKAFQTKNHNPLAKAIVDIITHYTIGKGFKLNWNSPKCQEIWDAYEKRDNLQEKVRVDSDGLTWQGEFMSRKGRKFGLPTLEQIDPSTVWDIITEPTDITTIYYYHQQFPTQYQLTYRPKDKASEFVINDIPADEVLHYKINATSGEKRGRSDLYPILGILKMCMDFYKAKVLKAQIEQSYAIKKKLKGNATDISAVANNPDLTKVPPFASVLIENEAIDTEYMTPTTSGGNAKDNVGEAIKALCATGVGLTPEFLGVAGGATQATAITKAEPSYRKFERRQLTFEDYLTNIGNWVMDDAAERGELPTTQVRLSSLATIKKALLALDFKGVIREAKALLTGKDIEEPLDMGFEVTFPEILTEDRGEKLKDIFNAMVAKIFSHETTANLVAKELGVTTYNYDEEMEKLRLELEDQNAKLFQATSGIPFQGFGQQQQDPSKKSSAGKVIYKDQARDADE